MSASAEPHSKAAGFTSAINVVRELVTAEQFNAILAAVSPETAQLVARPPLPSAWVRAAHWDEFMQAAARLAFGGKFDRFEEIGRLTLLSDMRGVYKVFIRLASPHFVIERATKIWGTYSRDNGELFVIGSTDRSVDVGYRGVRTGTPLSWEFQRGAVRGVLEATGVKNVRVDLVEGGGNTPEARLHARWD